MTTVGIVLAAGASRRFGREDKLTAQLRGRPLAAHAAAAMRGADFSARIAVVSNDKVAVLFNGFEIVRLPEVSSAQSDSVRAGLDLARRHGADRIVIALGDMPFVTASLLEDIEARSRSFGAAACGDGERRMPPAAFSARHFATLESAAGERGGQSIIRSLPAEAIVMVPETVLADADTPEQLNALEARSPKE